MQLSDVRDDLRSSAYRVDTAQPVVLTSSTLNGRELGTVASVHLTGSLPPSLPITVRMRYPNGSSMRCDGPIGVTDPWRVDSSGEVHVGCPGFRSSSATVTVSPR